MCECILLLILYLLGGSSIEEAPLASLSVLKSFEMQIDVTNKTYDVDYWYVCMYVCMYVFIDDIKYANKTLCM